MGWGIVRKVVLLVLVFVPVLPGISGGASPIDNDAVFPSDLAAIPYARQGDAVVARVDGNPVSDGMIKDYVQAYGGKNRTPAEEVDDFLNREIVLRDFLEKRLDADASVSRQVRLFYLSALGQRYKEDVLPGKVGISADEVALMLPPATLRGSFDLIVFGTEAEARDALKETGDAARFLKYTAEHPDRVKNTGEIVPGSGFFHDFDDKVLFSARTGDFAGYMETGLGPAIVYVKIVRSLSQDEKEKLIEDGRRNLVSNKVKVRVNEIVFESGISVKGDAIREMAGRDVKGQLESWMNGNPKKEGDRVVAEVSGIPLTYFDVRNWLPYDYKKTMRGITPETLAKYLQSDTQNYCVQIALGLKSQAEGHLALDDNFNRALGEFKRRFYHEVALGDQFSGMFVIPDADARQFYDDNREKYFRTPESADVAHIFTEKKKTAEHLLRRLRNGEEFEELARKESEDKATRENGGRMKGVLPDSNYVHESIRKAVFGKKRKTGVVMEVIESAAGFHIFKVYKYVPPKDVGYEDALPGIRTMLLDSRLRGGLKKYHARLRKSHKIEVVPDRMAALKKWIEERRPAQVPGYH